MEANHTSMAEINKAPNFIVRPQYGL
jgi:hypothetical protein